MAVTGKDLPFNFPTIPALSQKRQLFSNYGTSLFTASTEGEVVFQINKGDDFNTYSPVNPILPLSSVAHKVSYPVKDRIMGHILEQNIKMKEFSQQIVRFYQHSKRQGKYAATEAVKKTVEDIQTCLAEGAIDESAVEAELAGVNDIVKGKKWLRDFVDNYGSLKKTSTILLKNYKYAGGCIASLQPTDSNCYIAMAGGDNFDVLELSLVSEKKNNVLQCYTTEKSQLPRSIYSISSRNVQGQDYIAARLENRCQIFRFDKDSSDHQLKKTRKLRLKGIQCVDISPYIPEECIAINNEGFCYLWSADTNTQVLENVQPRFPVAEAWRHVQFGSHPRQIVYADQSMVQIYDLRTPDKEATDLFSLPSSLLRTKERLHMYGRHPASGFYHLVATDDNLMVLDERFPQSPVLKWEHMMSAPPQYVSCIEKGVTERDCHSIYLASQFPAETHVFRFMTDASQPPVAVSVPYRVSSRREFCDIPEYTDTCPNTDTLLEQLKSSNAGITAFRLGDRHVLLQLDSYGEVFHQVFKPGWKLRDDSLDCGSEKRYTVPDPVAVKRAEEWVESWVNKMKQQMTCKRTSRPRMSDLLGIFHYREPHKMCRICRPELRHMPVHEQGSSREEFCGTCMVTLSESASLIKCAEKDTIFQSNTSARPSELTRVEVLPANTALSKLLKQHWERGYQKDELSDLLQDWDTEVKAKMKKQHVKKTEQPDMSEESVMKRICSQSSQGQSAASGEEPALLNLVAGSQYDETYFQVFTPSVISLQDIELSTAKSVASFEKRSVPGSSCKKARLAKDKDQISPVSSVITDSEYSFVPGSVVSFDSGIFNSQVRTSQHVEVGLNMDKKRKSKHQSPKVASAKSPGKDSGHSFVAGSVESDHSETLLQLPVFETPAFTQLQSSCGKTRHMVGDTYEWLCNQSESLFSEHGTDDSLCFSSDNLSPYKNSSSRKNVTRKKKKQRHLDKTAGEDLVSEKQTNGGGDHSDESLLSVKHKPDDVHEKSTSSTKFSKSTEQNTNSPRSSLQKSSQKKLTAVTEPDEDSVARQNTSQKKLNTSSSRKATKRKLVDGF